jgi:3-hydroxybutyrate dehydrogenase
MHYLALPTMPAINDWGAVVRWPARPLLGRVAVVTRSTGGIGLAIASALAAQGVQVMLNGPSGAKDMKQVVASLGGRHRVAVAYSPQDATTRQQACALLEYARAELGTVDILVNCPALAPGAPIDDPEGQLWESVLALNLSSSYHTISAALPGMMSRNWGRIVNVIPAQAWSGTAGHVAHVAAHHGLLGLTRAVAQDCATSGITCNAVCPVEPSVTLEQVGGAAASLCSVEASSVRGVALNVGGGEH